jgi:restriction endonuclease S subunit
MAVFSIMKLSELEGAKRISAEFYKPHFLRIKHNLIKLGAKPLKNYITLLYRYPTFYNLEYRKEGVLVLKGEDIVQGGFVQNQSQDYISLEDASRFPKTILEEGDLIFSVRGYVGKIGIIDKKYVGSIISANLIRAKISGLSSYFVWVFLNSKYGSSQLDRIKMMTSQETVVADDIRNLLIFEPSKNFQKEIETLSINAINQFRNSENLYSQAENLLLEELGLKDFKPKYEKTYTAKLSDAFSAHRIDAEYFQPAYEEILRIVSKKHSLIPLKVIFDFRRGVFIPTNFYSEQKTGRPYIRIKELSGKLGIDESKIIFISDDYPNDEINQLQENDLVIAIIGDTIGKTNRLPKELAGGFCSNNTGRLRIKLGFKEKVLPEYAEILFQSIVIQSQIEKKKAQTGQPKISDNEIKSMKIPLLPLSIQQEIASLVQQSHEARKKAKELLETAKKAVEIAIEEGEEKAIDFLSRIK